MAFGRLHALYIPFVDSLANHFQIPDLIVGHIDQGVFVVGITTIDDAVEACRRTHLQGWDLVAYAQNLAVKKFTYL